ncbi:MULTISPECIES: acetyl-CoA carboxylase biotin carboxyl carrier protein [Clostridium]|uniref:acetyl-CoA carboxylase biotin carboxyl carrier protein n=1 Tax=Clostridium TaxID=1485 RepID=UPI00069DF4AF|nr:MULTISPECIES: acetyl-CoA carboxylase biotin carboxyl carrier protein [Clostridium]KOF58211.1 acetyl-CoA carboxylase [Clostridium sp. DMHC 10]MCD2346370.1 acetyl-CoA carboxylase biotin carboxyl carrier protein [Clostridium guangxiense]
MDYKAIEQIIKTAGESGLTFLEIETEGMRITMKKGNDNDEPKVKNEECVLSEAENKQDEAVIETVEKKEDQSKKVQDENIVSVVSPIVGTFYASSSPDTEAFVKVGSKVKKGDALCIIEAMKLMNEIEAEVDGEIVEILVEDEQMVEYGQELFKIALK